MPMLTVLNKLVAMTTAYLETVASPCVFWIVKHVGNFSCQQKSDSNTG